jgi:hypothetical protein
MTFRKSAGKRTGIIATLSLLIGAAAFSGCTQQTGAVAPSREVLKDSVRRQEEAYAKSTGRAGRGQPQYKSIKGKLLEAPLPE